GGGRWFWGSPPPPSRPTPTSGPGGGCPPPPPGPADRVRAWSETTFEHLAGLAADDAPGVRMCASMALYREEPAMPAWARSVRSFRAADRNELPPGYRFGFRFEVPLVEMPTYLPFLSAQVDAAGARRVLRTVARLGDLADLAPDVVVNCAGLRSAELVGDPEVYPIRGQIVRVANPGLSVSVRDEAHPLGRAYVHPRANDCVLGGSLDTGEWDTTPNPDLTRSILRRCRELAPALADSEVLGAVVGLRPGRREVRVELDTTVLPGIPVVHNYGHGGSGITIGHGCALESAALVASL
ncbi:FAD-dependent oxidoreductase, partial [Nocardia abscessus]|uniref:FAD-dependent oxidoreductase n=1 Tax=Nocardia abscessus TaxID=120957 RepID=UPI0024576498